jgi:hypothetical protein
MVKQDLSELGYREGETLNQGENLRGVSAPADEVHKNERNGFISGLPLKQTRNTSWHNFVNIFTRQFFFPYVVSIQLGESCIIGTSEHYSTVMSRLALTSLTDENVSLTWHGFCSCLCSFSNQSQFLVSCGPYKLGTGCLLQWMARQEDASNTRLSDQLQFAVSCGPQILTCVFEDEFPHLRTRHRAPTTTHGKATRVHYQM